MPDFIDLTAGQNREKINSDQRFQAFEEARLSAASFRGSLSWQRVDGQEYLARDYYDSAGLRRQKSEGKRSPDTERLKTNWEDKRQTAKHRLKSLTKVMDEQIRINRALRLGRVPKIGAQIIRAIDRAGLLGHGIRIVGTNALYAYEAAAAVHIEPAITATLDIDLLMDARRSLRIAMDADDRTMERTLIGLLKKADRSFERSRQTFRAVNAEGYLVDVIKPQSKTPWQPARDSVGEGPEELVAASIDGLIWLENAPSFEAIAIDERGEPLSMVAIDPRVFAIHKFWLSRRLDREAGKRKRDAAQALCAAQIVTRYFPHLRTGAEDLRMLPRAVYAEARHLFDL